nr:histone-lysine N-methyltransferase SETDB1-like [Oncorhynchus nerka]
MTKNSDDEAEEERDDDDENYEDKDYDVSEDDGDSDFRHNVSSMESHAGMPKYYRRDGTAEGNDKQASNATRRFFDGEESCYIINANLEGNVSRYLNVSHEEE